MSISRSSNGFGLNYAGVSIAVGQEDPTVAVDLLLLEVTPLLVRGDLEALEGVWITHCPVNIWLIIAVVESDVT